MKDEFRFPEKSSTEHSARDGSGKPIEARSGVFPILLELRPGTLKVVGTAFYITRYGLFLTAAHVLLDVFDEKKRERGAMFALHLMEDGKLNLRGVVKFNY